MINANNFISLINLTAQALRNLQAHPSSSDNTVTVFHTTCPPNISLEAYIYRFVKYASLDDRELKCAFIFIKRYIENKKQFFNDYNSYRLIAAAIVLAQKAYSDEFHDLYRYAQIAGISYREMLSIEQTLIKELNWELFITTTDLIEHEQHLSQDLCIDRFQSPEGAADLSQSNQQQIPSSNSSHRERTAYDPRFIKTPTSPQTPLTERVKTPTESLYTKVSDTPETSCCCCLPWR